VRRLVGRLRRLLGPSPAGPWRPTDEDHLRALPPPRRIGSDADPSDLARAALRAAYDRAPVGRAAMVDTLGALDGRRWLAVDQELRRLWWDAPEWPDPASPWPHGGPDPAVTRADRSDSLRDVVAACHRDGRLREAAVRRLAGRREPAALAVLAIRCADWVTQVRDAARPIVADALSTVDGAASAVVVDVTLAARARHEGGWLAAHVDRLLRDLPAPALEPLLVTGRRPVRRAA